MQTISVEHAGATITFNVFENAEPDGPGEAFLVEQIENGVVTERFCTDDLGSILPPEESFEQRHRPFGPEWEAEEEARRGLV